MTDCQPEVADKTVSMTCAAWLRDGHLLCAEQPIETVRLTDKQPHLTAAGFIWSNGNADKDGKLKRPNVAHCLPPWIFRKLAGFRKVAYSKSRIYRTKEAAVAALSAACLAYARGRTPAHSST